MCGDAHPLSSTQRQVLTTDDERVIKVGDVCMFIRGRKDCVACVRGGTTATNTMCVDAYLGSVSPALQARARSSLLLRVLLLNSKPSKKCLPLGEILLPWCSLRACSMYVLTLTHSVWCKSCVYPVVLVNVDSCLIMMTCFVYIE